MTEAKRELLVYSNFAQVRETLCLTGGTRLYLPECALLETLQISSGGVPVPFNVIPAVTDRKYENVVVTLCDGETIKGKLLGSGCNDCDGLKIEDDCGKVTLICKYKRVDYCGLNRHLVDVCLNGSSQITYLLSKVTWRPLTMIKVDVLTGKFKSVQITGVIDNKTGDKLCFDTIHLITGDRHLETLRSRDLLKGEFTQEDRKVHSTCLKELLFRTVVTLTTTCDDTCKDTIYWASSDEDDDDEKEKETKVVFGYRWVSNTSIPGGLVNFYAADDCWGVGTYLGATVVEEIKCGDEVDLKIGTADRVKVAMKDEESDIGGKISASISNQNDRDVTVVIQKETKSEYPVQTRDGLIRRGEYLEKEFNVKARDTTDVYFEYVLDGVRTTAPVQTNSMEVEEPESRPSSTSM